MNFTKPPPLIRKAFWLMVRRYLTVFCAGTPQIQRAYLRHTAAFEYPNPLLSDFDVTFFVNCSSLKAFRELSCAITRRLKASVFKHWVPHAIVLPATAQAFEACRRFYPLRSLYPLESWLPLEESTLRSRSTPPVGLPLDHTPESFLATYIVPAIVGDIPQRPLQSVFLWRKARQYRQQKGQAVRRLAHCTLEGSLQREVESWDRFYADIAALNSSAQAAVHLQPLPVLDVLSEALSQLDMSFLTNHGVRSLWIYPYSLDDSVGTICVNFESTARGRDMRSALTTIHARLKSYPHLLVTGTETAMVGRINGLSRLSLFEPWLFKHAARCMYGDPATQRRIVEPGQSQMDVKFKEFFLYFYYSRAVRRTFPYAMYRATFTMDNFIRSGSMVFDSDLLKNIYGDLFVKEAAFNPQRELESLVDFQRDRLGCALFDFSSVSS